jgi:hypothetical protein
LSVEILMEMFKCPHNGQKFLPGDAVISLSHIQLLTVAGYYMLLSVLYL